MDPVRRMLEIEAIKQLKYHYMRCIDQKRWKEIGDCFTEDATCSYSGGRYAFEGRDPIVRFLVESMDRPSFLSSHRVHHPEIELVDEGSATGIWALEDTVIDTQHGITLQGAAFYEDRYRKQDGRWKLQHTGYERTFEQIQTRADSGWRITQSAWPVG